MQDYPENENRQKKYHNTEQPTHPRTKKGLHDVEASLFSLGSTINKPHPQQLRKKS